MADPWMDIDAEEIAELVSDRGETVAVYHATPCPDCQNQNAANESSRSEGCEYDCEDGQIYSSLALAADVVAVIYDYNKDIYVPEFGRVPSGQAKWISMANQITLGNQDRVVLMDREEEARQIIERGDDTLSHPFVFEVLRIEQGLTQFVEGEDWELVTGTQDNAGNPFTPSSINWLTDGPGEGETYSIMYLRRPRLIFRGDAQRPARNNLAGEKLVQRLNLTILPLANGR
ncbi:MAG TPA: hypothetical protein VGB77_22175 [Abditibacteriaceae bacterium]|jgi:hypothetical protein